MQAVLKRRRTITGLALSALAAGVLQVMPTIPTALAAPTGTLLASTADGASSASGSVGTAAVSAGGRYVAFTTTAPLAPGDENADWDVYRKDLTTGRTDLVSHNGEGGATGGASGENVSISDDGDVVVHHDVPSEGPGEVRWHRLSTGDRQRVDEALVGDLRVTGEGPAFSSVSADGNTVAFISQRSLTDSAADRGLYVKDMSSDQVTFVADASDSQIAISGDGATVAYLRETLVSESPLRHTYELFVQPASPNSDAQLVNSGTSANFWDPAGLLGPDALSRDGQQVAFWSDGDTFTEGGPQPRAVYRFDGTGDSFETRLRRVSEGPDGLDETADSGGTTGDWPKGAISADGQRVAFTSTAGFGQSESGGAFVKDFADGSVTLASVTTDGAPVGVERTTLDPDGSAVAFVTAAPAAPGDGNELADLYVTGADLQPPLDGLALTVAPSSQRAGVSDIDTNLIDVALLPVGFGALESAPLRSSPLRSSPLRSSPLRSSPLRSSPLRSSPLRSSPLRSSPLRSSSLPPLPLSTIPLFLDGGWAPLLVGTPFEGTALQAVTLQQVLALPTGLNAGLDALTLADVDITSTPLRSSPLQAFLLGGVPLSQLTTSAQFYCDNYFPLERFPAGTCAPDSTLEGLVAAGATPSDLGWVASLFVTGADLTGTVLHQYDIGSVDVELLGMQSLPVEAVPPTQGLPAGMVDPTKCVAADGCETLLDALTADALNEDYSQTGLGRILDQDRDEVAGLRFEDLIRAVVEPSQLSYAEVDLDGLVEQAEFDQARLVTYTAAASVRCDASGNLSLDVTLPTGFRYVPGSSTLEFGNAEGAFRDPFDGRGEGDRESVDLPPGGGDRGNVAEVGAAAEGDDLFWSLPSCSDTDFSGVSDDLRLTFDASPGVVLGTFTSDARLANDDFAADRFDSVRVDDAAPVTVGDAFESEVRAGAAAEPTIPVIEDHLYLSHISSADDIDTYELPAGLEAGTRVTAVLSHLQADFDLFLDGPVAAPLRSSPLRSSPLRSSPIEDLDAPGAQGGDVIEAETLQDIPLRSSILSQSATSGTEDEQVTTVLTATTTVAEPATLAVTHHLGSSSDQPYLLQITLEAPVELECPDAGPTVPFGLTSGTGVPGTLPDLSTMTAAQKAAVKTLFLVNQERLGDAYGPVAAQQITDRLTTLSGRAEVGGLVLPVEGRLATAEAYAAWDADRCSPEAANDVVRAIGATVDVYAAQLPQLRYLTFVGDDDIVPFARIPDGASLSNQREYQPEVKFDDADNAISAAFGRGFVLSDNVLLAKEGLDFLGHQLPVPDYAGGRLVETPEEMLKTITQYEARGFIDTSRTLVTGYDFLSDLSPVLYENLTGTPAPADDEKFLNSETWTRSDLDAALAAAPTVAGVNAHYDHSNALPAAGNAAPSPQTELFTSADLKESGLPAGALLFTLGCQGGLSVPGRAWAAATTPDELARLEDFAQVMAQKQAAGFLGNTGYGYGDTVLLAYSERFLELFSSHLKGTMTVSQAITKAKQDYLKDGLIGVYDEKVLNEATYYGLPFVTVGPGGVAGPAPTAPAAGAVPVETLFGTPVRSGSTGNIVYDTLRSTPRGQYFSVVGEQPLVEHFRPIQPAIQETLTAAPSGRIVGDVWFTRLVSRPNVQEGTFDPVFSVPTVDAASSSLEPEIRSVAFPVSLGTVTPRGTLALFPGQYRSGDVPGRGTQLLFERMDYKVFYPTTSLAERPGFSSVDATVSPDGTLFRIGIDGAQGATVLAKPVASATWVEVPLTQTQPGFWTGSSSLQIEEYLVQAANEGRVGTTRAKGVNYTPSPADDAAIVVEPVGPVASPAAIDPWSRQPVTVSSTQSDVEARLVGAPVALQAASAATPAEATGEYQRLPLTVTPDGVHELEYRTVGQTETRSLLIAIDKTPPVATITNPTDGGTVTSANRTATFTCADATSGIRSCTALDPTTLNVTAGPHVFRVLAVDNAGGEHLATVSYRGVSYAFEGFFSPVDNSPVVNVVQPGSTVPVKFRLRQDGAVVTDTRKVTSIQTTALVSCPSGPGDSVEELAPSNAPGGLVYDAAAQRFQYNWKTTKAARGCYKLTFTFADGHSRFALFRFK